MKTSLLDIVSGALRKPWWKTLVLIALLGVGLGVRLVNLFDPPLDFHPVRQLRSALIARSVYYTLDPRVAEADRQQAAGLAALESYEPPLIEQIAGAAYLAAGGEKLWLPRVFSIIYWLVGGLALFWLGRHFAGFWASLTGLAFYLGLPFAIQASRAFMPDPWMVMWILVAAVAAVRWSDRVDWKWTVLAGLASGMAVFAKVVAGLFVIPMLVLAAGHTLGLRRFYRSLQVWAILGLALVPALIYYLGVNGAQAASYFSYNTLGAISLVFTSKFYAQWLAMVNSLTGLTALVAAFLGICLAKSRFRAVLIGLWIGYAAYGLGWPYQYTTHEYYHLMIVPLIGLSIMPLLDLVYIHLSAQPRLARIAAVIILLAALAYQMWVGRSILAASDHRAEPLSWQLVGQALPPGAPFVALVNDYGFRLAYYGGRAASFYWPNQSDLTAASARGQNAVQNPAEYFQEVTNGKSYFLVAALEDFEAQSDLNRILTNHYPLYRQGAGWMVYDLSKPH